MDGVAQPAAAQISVMDTPLDHAHDEAMPLVEWARTPMGIAGPKEEYASMTASTIHLESFCFVTRMPFGAVTEANKELFRTPKGRNAQSRFSELWQGITRINSRPPQTEEAAESVMTWALNGVESTLGT